MFKSANKMSKINFGIFLAAIFLLIFVFIILYKLFINQSVDSKPNTTDIYIVDNISVAQEKIIEKFNNTNGQKINVIPINLPFDIFNTNERKELLSRSLRSKNNRIDLLAIDYIWVNRFSKWAQPLEEYLSEVDTTIFLNYSLEACKHDNKLVCLPYYIDVGLLFYRKDLIRSFPDSENLEKRLKDSITWEELFALKAKYPEITNPFYLFPANHYEGLVCSLMEAVVSLNSSVFDTLNAFKTNQAHKGLTLLYNLIHTHKLTPVNVTDFQEKESYEYAFQNNALFFRGWPGNEREFKEKYPEIVANLGIAALPHPQGGSATSVFGGWNLMISSASQHKKEAFEFLKFIFRKDNQMILYEEMGLLPANKLVYSDSLYVLKNPELIFYKKLLDRGFHRPMIEDYTKKSDIISFYVNQALDETLTVEEALLKAEEMIESNRVLIH